MCRSRSMHVDTGKKFPRDVRLPRPLRAEWKLNLMRRGLPALRGDRPDPAAGRPLGRSARPWACGPPSPSTASTASSPASAATRRPSAPRSASSARAATAGQWDFKDQPPEFWDQFNTDLPAGTHLRVHPLLHWTEVDIWRYIRREGIPGDRSLFRPRHGAARTASATARSATRTSPFRSTARPRRWTRSSPSSTPPRRRSVPAAPWTARPRTPSSGCAPTGYM